MTTPSVKLLPKGEPRQCSKTRCAETATVEVSWVQHRRMCGRHYRRWAVLNPTVPRVEGE